MDKAYEEAAKISFENIENNFGHQAKIVIQCLRGIKLFLDNLIYREVDYEVEEEQDK